MLNEIENTFISRQLLPMRVYEINDDYVAIPPPHFLRLYNVGQAGSDLNI
jgi:hypothetical protein